MGAEVEVRVVCRGPHTIARDLNEPEPFCPICLESSDYPAPREGYSARLVDPEAVLRVLLEAEREGAQKVATEFREDVSKSRWAAAYRRMTLCEQLLSLLAPASPEEKP